MLFPRIRVDILPTKAIQVGWFPLPTTNSASLLGTDKRCDNLWWFWAQRTVPYSSCYQFALGTFTLPSAVCFGFLAPNHYTCIQSDEWKGSKLASAAAKQLHSLPPFMKSSSLRRSPPASFKLAGIVKILVWFKFFLPAGQTRKSVAFSFLSCIAFLCQLDGNFNTQTLRDTIDKTVKSNRLFLKVTCRRRTLKTRWRDLRCRWTNKWAALHKCPHREAAWTAGSPGSRRFPVDGRQTQAGQTDQRA